MQWRLTRFELFHSSPCSSTKNCAGIMGEIEAPLDTHNLPLQLFAEPSAPNYSALSYEPFKASKSLDNWTS